MLSFLCTECSPVKAVCSYTVEGKISFPLDYYLVSGSLMNLAKHPSSTVQILGAEKALFRALKTKHDTPKYGLIYHASLVGQSNPKIKGKVRKGLTVMIIEIEMLQDFLQYIENLEKNINWRCHGKFDNL